MGLIEAISIILKCHDLGINRLRNCFVPDGTKPSPEPMSFFMSVHLHHISSQSNVSQNNGRNGLAYMITYIKYIRKNVLSHI